ncbi:hypothetical protein [Streptacidiphilus carbonis]|jgi:hypothetical protein|uniref:hypothetical protein n=1 Tax=Streptacidiphilus carbonis TaxID=105422 RepID=UPI0005AA54D2|nr:hypothetical protein [Streptacidiphilus carbonis]
MPRYDHYSREHLEMLRRLEEAKPSRLLQRPDSPHMGTLWEGRYTVVGGRLARWVRIVPGFRARARRAEYVVEIDRAEVKTINFRLEDPSGEVVARIRFNVSGAFKGMTYRELTARAATVMPADLRKQG